MRCAALVVGLALTVAGCGGSSASNQPTPTLTVGPSRPNATTGPAGTPTGTGSKTGPTAEAVPNASAPYRSFVSALCGALAHDNTAALTGDLSNYQYNTGVRWGYLGDGEGNTSAPSIFSTWLGPRSVRCSYFTPDRAGHGAVLSRGWKMTNGPWAILELDTYNGQWKINDLTFGRPGVLYQALLTGGPAVTM